MGFVQNLFCMRSFLIWVWILPSLGYCDLRIRVSSEGNLNPNIDDNDDFISGLSEDPEEARKMAAKMRELAVYMQTVTGSPSTDTVTVEFRWADGTIISQLTDFRMQSQIMRILIPGEEDLGQPPHQAFCFVSSFVGDLIPPEAVAKLRQKNPSTVRVADEDRGEVVQDSKLRIVHSKMHTLSSHLPSFCKDTRDSVLSSEHELFNILDAGGHANPNLEVANIAKEAIKDSEHLPRCFAVSDRRHPCICSLRVCLDWYPCALKYCKNRDSEGEHRCGIKTCRKCLTFRYPVKVKNLCMWDKA